MRDIFPISGIFDARKLRSFILRDNVALASLQETLTEAIIQDAILNAWGHELDLGTEESETESEQDVEDETR
jgi:hypothetical protein